MRTATSKFNFTEAEIRLLIVIFNVHIKRTCKTKQCSQYLITLMLRTEATSILESL
jgi:hypothetical protein